MVADWLGTSWTGVWLVIVSTVAIVAAVITYTRIAGLRSFSKMSSFDFAITVAFGSLIGTVSVSSTSLLNGLIGLSTLFAFQSLIAVLRRRAGFSAVVDNEPMLLMAGERILDDNLTKARVTVDDVRAKLREANVLNTASVRAVILESTGDISVLHGDDELDLELLADVRDADQLESQGEGGGVRAG